MTTEELAEFPSWLLIIDEQKKTDDGRDHYVVLYDLADGRQMYHSRCKGGFSPQERREWATIFLDKRCAEREADKMLMQENNLVCCSIQKA